MNAPAAGTNYCTCRCVALQVSADWERASLQLGQQYSQQYSQPSSKPGPAAATEGGGGGGGGFINTSLVGGDEESQEFDDLIFALKTGEDAVGLHSLPLVGRPMTSNSPEKPDWNFPLAGRAAT